jgi:hypothetical protein
MLLVPTGQPIYGYGVSLRQSFLNALATRPAYDRAVAFTACAVAGQPALWAASQTDLVSWGGYPRPPFDGLWIDQAPLGLAFVDDAFYTIPPDQWAAFETLVYVSNPEQRASLARFPQMNGLRHQAEYASLLQRLPVEVAIDRGWTYRGGERLAACATQYGYPSRTVRAAP